MNKLILLIVTLLLTSCVKTEGRKEKLIEVDIKNCITKCRKYEFKNLHNNGESWGTGSSSLTSFSENQTIDKINKICEEFYLNVKCCETNILSSDRINRIHDYFIGECR